LKTLDAVKKEVISLKKKITDANNEINIMENKIAIKRSNWTASVMADNDQAVILKEELDRFIETYNKLKKNRADLKEIEDNYFKSTRFKNIKADLRIEFEEYKDIANKKNEALKAKFYALCDEAIEIKAEMELNYINAKEEIDIFNEFEVLSTSRKRANKISLDRPILETFEDYEYNKFTKNKVIDENNIRFERQMKLVRKQREDELKRLELQKQMQDKAIAEINARAIEREKARAERDGRTYAEIMPDMPD
jgi:hypothetical protein